MKRNACTVCSVLFAIVLIAAVLSGCSGVVPETIAPLAESVDNQIIISEVMSSNTVFYPAADGRCYDWVEFHNLSDRTYDLSSCYLTDDERSPKKCQLTGVVLEPGGYAVVYLSGLGGVDVENRLHTGFKLSSMGETIYLNDSAGVVMFSLEVPELADNVSYGFASGEKDYSKKNAVWFASPTPGDANDTEAVTDPSQVIYHTNGVIINEYMIGNSYFAYDADGDYSDWVELHNPTQTDADMTGYMLSDDPDAISKWKFPEGTVIPAGGYLTIYCSGKNKTDSEGNLHTGFSLSTDDTDIILSNMQGAAASLVQIYNVPDNISCGYIAETDEWKLFARPTPGAANNTSSFALTELPTPDINDGVLISETLSASSASEEFKTDYIEIYNATSEAVDLGGYTLSQSPGEVVFTFPSATIAAGGYLLVWCDGTESRESGDELHAPLKINTGGEDLYLADASGRIVDVFNTGKQEYGVSSGRSGSDTSSRVFFAVPTPGAANSGTSYASYAPQPVFSRPGGNVESGAAITISVPANCTVRYTTDGTMPDESSAVYSEGQTLTVTETTVVKAVAYKENCLRSELTAATYFVDEPHTIPVISMSGFGLIDHENGIMVDGEDKNYNRGWVRNVHVEYYDEEGALAIEFDAGAEIFGQYSKTENKKGVRLCLREKYGYSDLTYPFFPESVSGVSTFRSLLLRPSGQDQTKGMIRDEVVVGIIRGRVQVDYQELRPCALYVNGQYWGLYYIRERLDEDYLISKYGFEEGKTDLVKSQIFEQAGTIDDYLKIQTFARENDLTLKKNYEYMKEQIDLDSLIDFWVIETYLANNDTGNIRCYRTEGGKWRWMAYDFDWAMAQSRYKQDFIYNHCLDKSGHGAADFNNAIIRKLLANDEFRDMFISRYCYHLNTTFDPERCIRILDQMAEDIRDEVPRNSEVWTKPSVSQWEDNLTFIRKFFNERPDIVKEQLMENFDLSEKQLKEYLKNNK